MTSYTLRVELHEADDGDYEDLHAAMAERGFVRWIKDKDGNKDQLPTADYNLSSSSLNRSQVRDRAEEAAKSVKPKPTPWVLVTESAGRSWSGLKSWKD